MSVSGDIDCPAIAVGECEAGLSAEDLRAEREAPGAALGLVGDVESCVGAGARVAEGLPVSAVMHEQLDDHALRRDWPDHPSAEHDRPRRARAARGHVELDARVDGLLDLRLGRVADIPGERTVGDLY